MNNATLMPLLEKISNDVNHPVLIVNTSCKIKSINKKAAQILDLDEEAGKPLPIDISASRWNSFLKEIRQEHVSFSSFHIQGKNSRIKEIKFFSIFLKKENCIYLRILEKEFYEGNIAFVNDLSNGVIFFQKGFIIGMNSQAVRLLQVDPIDILHKSLKDFLALYHRFEIENVQFFSDLKNYGQAKIEILKMLNREEKFLELDCKLNSDLDLLVMTIVDQTENYLLRKRVKELERLGTIGQMTASIAHEIKNPMTSLKGFIQLLKDSSTEEAKKYLQVMESELGSMEMILSEILYLAKPIERYDEIVSVLEVVTEVAQIMQPQAKMNKVLIQLKVDAELNSKIIGNSNRLKQIFINLVKNSIEGMPNGGMITIELKNVRNSLEVLVHDEGIGIPEESLNKLFIPFYTTKEQGTGLGLPLVKKIVDEHQGKISVKSVVNVGTTFIVEFPSYTESYNTSYYYGDTKIKTWMSRNEINSIRVM